MKILKFGGSSVKDAERIANVIAIVKNEIKIERICGVVFSACHGVTDSLIRISRIAVEGKSDYSSEFLELKDKHYEILRALIAKDLLEDASTRLHRMFFELEQVLRGVYLIGDLSPKISDFIISYGELLSNTIINYAFRSAGIKSEFLDARKLVRTDSRFGGALVQFEETNQNIKEYFRSHKSLQIITGFIAASSENETTTLGRGGSDYTASIFGAALKCSKIEIWTDVSGVLSADPKKVRDAFQVKKLDYEEAMELSHFGAKVIYPPTMYPAMAMNIPIHIKNTFEPSSEGSIISSETDGEFPIKGIASIDDISIIRIQGSGLSEGAGIAQRVFAQLSRHNINIIMINQASSGYSICLAILPAHGKEAKKILAEEFKYEIKNHVIGEIVIEEGYSIIAVVGKNMAHTPGIAARFFSALGDNDINISAIAQGSSELNISAVISRRDELKALNVIHHRFFSSGKQGTINLYLCGYGSVAKTLIDLIGRNGDLYHRIKLRGLMNSRKMLLSDREIPFNEAGQMLEARGISSNIDQFIHHIRTANLRNSVFADCTASEDIALKLIDVLKNGIHVVAANKKATAGKQEYFHLLKKTATEMNVRFLFETNVGAALPVVSTLNDLMRAGDKIIKIEGVLSGTLSFIFNNLSKRTKFSSLIKEAKQRGYTEPDVREDLSGKDAARKILVLIREAGFKMEMEDISIENLVPAKYRKLSSVEDFMRRLPELDEFYKKRYDAAAKKGKVLRYISSFSAGKASVRLMEVDKTHPAYNLAGTDNFIAYYTDFYNVTPQVVNGPGAGTQITSVGIISDIFKIFG